MKPKQTKGRQLAPDDRGRPGQDPKARPCNVLAIVNAKGGTGKTTTAAALAQAGAYNGRRVLAVDLDAQANLSGRLDGDTTGPGVAELLHGADPADVIQMTGKGVDLIAGTEDAAAEQHTAGSAHRLKKALDRIRAHYDFIIIDTPPDAISESTLNAIHAANVLLITAEADGDSLQGLRKIIDTARALEGDNAPEAWTVCTKYDGRARVSRFWRDAIRQRAEQEGAPLLWTIRAGVAVKEAAAFRRSLYEHAPNSKPAADYMALFGALELLQGLKTRGDKMATLETMQQSEDRKP